MAGLWWSAVAVILVAQNAASLDVAKLSQLVKAARKAYEPANMDGQQQTPMYSFALQVPFDKTKNEYDVSAVTTVESSKLQDDYTNCRMYSSPRAMAAMVLKYRTAFKHCGEENLSEYAKKKCPSVNKWKDWAPKKCDGIPDNFAEHAEYRTLEKLGTLSGTNKDDLMLFYCQKPPCDNCVDTAKELNILTRLPNLKKWTHFAYVFSEVYEAQGAAKVDDKKLEEKTRQSIKALGSVLHLENVYRCLEFGCVRCYSTAAVATEDIKAACVKAKFDNALDFLGAV